MTTLGLLRQFLRVRDDAEPLLAGLADRAVADFPFPLSGRLIVDVGCGTGHLANALRDLGHTVLATDLRFEDLRRGRPPGPFQSDATRLPIRTATVDGVVCSNVLEHTPTPDEVLSEIGRALRPGGWAWVSWTPWWGPFGGHAIAPFHYLGPERGRRVYERLLGAPKGRNLPHDGVWPTSVSSILETVRSNRHLDLVAAVPRYYPSQRWVMRMRHVREVLVWNCLLLLRKPQ